MVESWRRMTPRFRHGLGTAGPPRPFQADTPVTWVTKVTTLLLTKPRMGGFLNERIESSRKATSVFIIHCIVDFARSNLFNEK